MKTAAIMGLAFTLTTGMALTMAFGFGLFPLLLTWQSVH
jgi:hypothetical protein